MTFQLNIVHEICLGAIAGIAVYLTWVLSNLGDIIMFLLIIVSIYFKLYTNHCIVAFFNIHDYGMWFINQLLLLFFFGWPVYIWIFTLV